jgi:hypothetical protein
VIIVDPDEIPAFGLAHHGSGEFAIDFEIHAPISWIEISQDLKVVKERPNDLVR